MFDGKQDTELIYAGKTRDVDVLTETMAVPLQKVKVFGDGKDSEWHNMLIFGDNLQVLKTLLIFKFVNVNLMERVYYFGEKFYKLTWKSQLRLQSGRIDIIMLKQFRD